MSRADVLCAECERPVPDSLTLCRTCGDAVVTDLLAVPGLLVEMTVMRARLTRFAGGRNGGRSAETPLPVNASRRGTAMLGDGALTRLDTAVIGWTRVIAEDLAVSPCIGGPVLIAAVQDSRGGDRRHDPAAIPLAMPTPLEQAAIWLARHPHQIRAHEAACEMKREIAAALDELRRLVDKPAELRYLGPCPSRVADEARCGHGLRAQRGASWVRCGRCRVQHEIAAIEQRAREAAEDLLCTLAEVLRLTAEMGAPVAKTTLYRWARERRIAPRGWSHGDEYGVRITDYWIHRDDPAVYRLGDVLRLAEGRDAADGRTKTRETA